MAKLGAPVSHVILANNFVAHKLQGLLPQRHQ